MHIAPDETTFILSEKDEAELLEAIAEADRGDLFDADVVLNVAWTDELERRSQEVAAGLVQPIPWETAKAAILSEIKQRRAG